MWLLSLLLLLRSQVPRRQVCCYCKLSLRGRYLQNNLLSACEGLSLYCSGASLCCNDTGCNVVTYSLFTCCSHTFPCWQWETRVCECWLNPLCVWNVFLWVNIAAPSFVPICELWKGCLVASSWKWMRAHGENSRAFSGPDTSQSWSLGSLWWKCGMWGPLRRLLWACFSPVCRSSWWPTQHLTFKWASAYSGLVDCFYMYPKQLFFKLINWI